MPDLLNPAEFFIPGTAYLWVAKKSDNPTPPADIGDIPTNLDPAFKPIGYTTEADGVKFTYKPTLTKYPALQSIGPVAARVTAAEATVDAKMLQWSQASINAAFGGGVWSDTATGTRWDPPAAGGAAAEYVVVIQAIDGANVRGLVITDGIAGGAQIDETFKRGDQSSLALSIEVLSNGVGALGYYRLTDELGAGDPVNEVQLVTLTGSPTGGTFTLTFSGQTTSAIAYNATAATVKAALVALSNIGTNDVAVTGSAGGPWTVTFQGELAAENVPTLTKNAAGLTGGTSPDVSISTSTPGAPE